MPTFDPRRLNEFANERIEAFHKRRLVQNFEQAVRVLQQGDATTHVQPVLGICYGRSRTTQLRNYIKYEGQSFWHFLSGDPALYVNLIEPAGFRAREHSESFRARRKQVEKQFIEEFSRDYCYPDGTID
ncbi:MAG: PmeII family type II restriction endonuclease [Anaerolineaceae bacterium]|nr:PmeII family type II restriction endonuclease [Anaerolineaceae bacterium]